MDEQDLLGKIQCRFCKGSISLTSLQEFFEVSLNKGDQVDIRYLDFQKSLGRPVPKSLKLIEL